LDDVADGKELRSVSRPDNRDLRIERMRKILLKIFEEQARVAEHDLMGTQQMFYKSSRKPGLTPHRRKAERMPRRDDGSGSATIDWHNAYLKQRPQQKIAVTVAFGMGCDRLKKRSKRFQLLNVGAAAGSVLGKAAHRSLIDRSEPVESGFDRRSRRIREISLRAAGFQIAVPKQS
jgi:hypothetical protein